ncbi:hypothetical protein V6N13_099531 [Hibiscus sabdariffa]
MRLYAVINVVLSTVVGHTQDLAIRRRTVVFGLVCGGFFFPVFLWMTSSSFVPIPWSSARFDYRSFHHLKVDVPISCLNLLSHPSSFTASNLAHWFANGPSDCIPSRVICPDDNRNDMQ